MTEDLWGVDEFNEILTGVADARVDDAARSRSHRAWISEQVEAETTLAGFLTNLAGRDQHVTVMLAGGTELRGAVRAVGADVIALHLATGVALVPLRAVMAVRVDGTEVGAAVSVTTTSNRRFHDVLADAATDRRDVQIILSDGTRTHGQLRAVGVDVVTLRVGTNGGTTVLAAQNAVVACVLLDAR